jgi:hypothetical protein
MKTAIFRNMLMGYKVNVEQFSKICLTSIWYEKTRSLYFFTSFQCCYIHLVIQDHWFKHISGVCWGMNIPHKPALGSVGHCTFTLSLMNRLNQTDSAMFIWYFGFRCFRRIFSFSEIFLHFQQSYVMHATQTRLKLFITFDKTTCLNWIARFVLQINLICAVISHSLQERKYYSIQDTINWVSLIQLL